MTKPNKKSSFAMPHPIVLIYVLVILMVVLTWVIPSGEFQDWEKIRAWARSLPEQLKL